MSEPSEEALGIAARVWCEPETEHVVMIPALAMGFAKVVDKYLSRIEELESERRWIPVSERLPELNQDVLGLVDDEMLVGSFYQDLEHGIYFSDGGSCMLVATHWMPLPEPPVSKDAHVVYEESKNV